jgi:RNA polymerase sigma-70 factor (ECF subfamily)
LSVETNQEGPCILSTEEADGNVYRTQDEVSLLRASLEGETAAWGEIVSRYKDAVFGLCVGFLRNRADAEDITHDAFIRAYDNLRRYRLDKRFSTWIFTIAANLCRNKLRYRRNHPVIEPEFDSEGGADPAHEVAREQRQIRVRGALNRLPYGYRAPLVLRFYNDLSYREIGDILAIPEGTVKTRIHRGKTMLKELFEKERDPS